MESRPFLCEPEACWDGKFVRDFDARKGLQVTRIVQQQSVLSCVVQENRFVTLLLSRRPYQVRFCRLDTQPKQIIVPAHFLFQVRIDDHADAGGSDEAAMETGAGKPEMAPQAVPFE